jgi:hypothetical protein
MGHELGAPMSSFGRVAHRTDRRFPGVRLVSDGGAAMEQRPTDEPGDLHGFDGMCGAGRLTTGKWPFPQQNVGDQQVSDASGDTPRLQRLI